jgi:hypothetical protein
MIDSCGATPVFGVFSVRPYRAQDAAKVERLYVSVANPYRQEDADNVLSMQRRALRAQEAGDRWSPLRTEEPNIGEQAHLAFWVAVSTNGADEDVIGTLGLRSAIKKRLVATPRNGADYLRPGTGSAGVMWAKSVGSASLPRSLDN